MSSKIKVALKISKELYGGQDYTIIVEVTNTSDKPLTSIEVDPQLIPGTILSQQETESYSELDELQERKRRLFREMEEQVATAYEQQRLRKLNIRQQVVLVYARMPDVIASMITRTRAKMFRVPYWATEATRINDWDDIERLEKDFIENEKDDSLLRKSFLANKAKVESVIKRINANGTKNDQQGGGTRLMSGDTISFSYLCRAPNLYRQKTLECQFRITYRDPETGKLGNVPSGESLSFYASAFAVPFGAVLGALAGFVVKVSFMSTLVWFSKDFWTQLLGSTLLATIIAFVTSRSPERKKLITVEDFVGGFVIGAMSAIFSGQLLDYLESLLPK